MTEKYKSEEVLRDLYHGEELGCREIAERLDCAPTTVSYWMDKHEIGSREAGRGNENGKYRDREWLVEQYHDFGRSMSMIADDCGVSATAIGYWMDKYGIETRVAGEGYRADADYKDRELLEEMYVERGWSTNRIADEFDLSQSKAWYWLDKYGIEKRSLEESVARLNGEDSPLWTGGYEQYYGKTWSRMRDRVRNRDDNVCQLCGIGEEENGRKPDVHHIEPVRLFEDPNDAHFMENMIQLCRSCHKKVEFGVISLPPELPCSK